MRVNTHSDIFLSFRLGLILFEQISSFLKVELTHREASAQVTLSLKHLTHIIASYILLRVSSWSSLDSPLILIFFFLVSEGSHESHDAVFDLISSESKFVPLYSNLLALILLLILSLFLKLLSNLLSIVKS